MSVLQYVPGSAGLIAFGGAGFRTGCLIHAIRQRVDEINLAGGELFDVLKSGDTVLVHSGPFAAMRLSSMLAFLERNGYECC